MELIKNTVSKVVKGEKNHRAGRSREHCHMRVSIRRLARSVTPQLSLGPRCCRASRRGGSVWGRSVVIPVRQRQRRRRGAAHNPHPRQPAADYWVTGHRRPARHRKHRPRLHTQTAPPRARAAACVHLTPSPLPLPFLQLSLPVKVTPFLRCVARRRPIGSAPGGAAAAVILPAVTPPQGSLVCGNTSYRPRWLDNGL